MAESISPALTQVEGWPQYAAVLDGIDVATRSAFDDVRPRRRAIGRRQSRRASIATGSIEHRPNRDAAAYTSPAHAQE